MDEKISMNTRLMLCSHKGNKARKEPWDMLWLGYPHPQKGVKSWGSNATFRDRASGL